MKSYRLILFLACILPGSLLAFPIDGTWQGVLIFAGQKMDKGTLLYIDFSVSGSRLSGKMREEVYNTEDFAVKQFNGDLKNGVATLRQTVVEQKSKKGGIKWCLLQMTLRYDSISGYMEGSFNSSECKRAIGKVILYKMDAPAPSEIGAATSQLWFANFTKDYAEGLNAPLIRDLERANFVFEPIYFDFDKFEIRPEHCAFLDRLIKVVKGHSDLRVKVIGHTDSDGTDDYNEALSKNRAQAIVNYFVSKGLQEDRLIFDFKGEKQPVDTNDTPEGKQRNRRVDFSFI